jgi:ABC-type transport system involved in cytochrome c biogenesis permease subunit
MKFSAAKLCTWLVLLAGAVFVLAGFAPGRPDSPYDLTGFGRIPVQFGTRVLPLDSVARNTLRLFSDRATLTLPASDAFPDGLHMPAIQWFLELALRPEAAERLPVFTINHDDLLSLIGHRQDEQQGRQLYSFQDLSPHLADIDRAAQAADDKKDDNEALSAFDREVSQLRDNLVLFQRLGISFVPPGETPAQDWKFWQDSLQPGSAAFQASEAGKPFDQDTLNDFLLQSKRYLALMKGATAGVVPPRTGKTDDAWANVGEAAMQALTNDQLSPILVHYGQLGEALRADNPAAFNTAMAALTQDFAGLPVMPRIRYEAYLNAVEPFFRGAILYVGAFLCACLSWVVWGPELRRAALGLVALGFALQTFGLLSRVYLTGFGIVTDLYSSALFVGWVAVLGGLILECWKKGGLGAAVASFIGFATLVIAHNLPFNGDNLELPRAVLASNFWLWTHVKVITFGYGAMFLAGTLGVGYILAGAFTARLTTERARELARLVYGITCFATLFSFVGTMLGGIWADQSWGRFWGWDPKENGALLIVLWCAICLHARWGKLCGERTQMALAVGGNIVTAWSWFGTNLLGVGLHSYGFVQGTFVALTGFWISQLAIIAVALLPTRYWRSRTAWA